MPEKPDPRLTAAPVRHIVVVTCMDARVDPRVILGLRLGDAHILRNAGGLITEDMERSVILSQRRLGTREVVILQHTKCGLHRLDEEQLRAEISRDTGQACDRVFHGFKDLEASVRAAVERLRNCAELPYRDRIRGGIYDVQTGQVRMVVELENPGVS